MSRELKTRLRERIVRPVVGRIVGHGRLVGTALVVVPVAIPVVLSWLNVSLGTWVARVWGAAGLGSMLLGLEVLSLTSQNRCPVCRHEGDSSANYCDRCGADVSEQPTGLEQLAEGADQADRPLVERDEVRASVESSRHDEDVLIAEHTAEGKTVLYRVDADVWEAISEKTNGEVYV